MNYVKKKHNFKSEKISLIPFHVRAKWQRNTSLQTIIFLYTKQCDSGDNVTALVVKL